MSTFSGTNLPPIVRLGGTADTLMNLDGGTLYATAPEHVRRILAVPADSVSAPTIKKRAKDPIKAHSDFPSAKPARGQKKRRKRR